MKNIVSYVAVALLPFFCFGVPEISNVELSERGDELVVAYTLSENAIVVVDIQTNASEEAYASIGGNRQWTLEGDVNKAVEKGLRSFTWTPCVDLPDQDVEAAKIKVVFYAYASGDAPDYMVVDLAPSSPCRVQYYPDAESLPGGLLSNGSYRASKIVMRHIPARSADFFCGTVSEASRQTDGRETLRRVSLTNDFWIGVFEATYAQTAIFGSSVWLSVRPVKNTPWNNIRGDAAKYSWPYAVKDTSILGKIRTRTGVPFDLPGEIQWEFACRAGNGEGLWNDGTYVASDTAARLAHYGKPWSKTDCGIMVGSLAPSSWGIYDMHGNVHEYCLDWWQKDISGLGGCINSSGPTRLDGTTTSEKVVRGGCFTSGWGSCRSALRSCYDASSYKHEAGFRFCSVYGFQEEALLSVEE